MPVILLIWFSLAGCYDRPQAIQGGDETTETRPSDEPAPVPGFALTCQKHAAGSSKSVQSLHCGVADDNRQGRDITQEFSDREWGFVAQKGLEGQVSEQVISGQVVGVYRFQAGAESLDGLMQSQQLSFQGRHTKHGATKAEASVPDALKRAGGAPGGLPQ